MGLASKVERRFQSQDDLRLRALRRSNAFETIDQEDLLALIWRLRRLCLAMSRQEGRAPHRPCRRNSLVFALLSLALAVREIERAGTAEAPFDQFASTPDRWEQRRVEDAVVPYETLSGQNCSLMVLILSARENFASRQRIRTSWKHQGSSCIYFMVGDDFCEVPLSIRKEWTCEERDESEPDMTAQKHHDSVQSEVQGKRVFSTKQKRMGMSYSFL